VTIDEGTFLARPRGTEEPTPLSLRLKDGTREAHDSVERAAAFNRLIVVKIPGPGHIEFHPARHAQALTEYREIYRRFLIGAHGFEDAVNRRILESPAYAAAVASGYAAEDQEPTTLIRQDMHAVFGPKSTDALTPMDDLAPVRTLPELVGVEYVRRGSRAGGAVISAVVEQNLGFTREHGASFLAQYGKRTRSVLVAMKAWIDSMPFSEAQSQEAIAAASAAFAAVERYHLRLEASFAGA
jgi:heme oxygenase